MKTHRSRTSPTQIETKCDQCGALLYYSPSRFAKSTLHFCDKFCQGQWRSTQTDSKAAHWKGGEKADAFGRVYWKLPWHPRADKKGYVPRAFIVAELKLGRPVAPGEIVHHKDEDPSNDHPDNLEVLASQAEHARLHSSLRSPEQMAAMRAKRGAA